MSRPIRILAAGGLYHVVARGNAKMTIFCDDTDHHRFLTILDATLQRYLVECHAYCLMRNHYHLVVHTHEANLSTAIQYLNGVYAQWWNRRHARVGHVLQGRFKGQLMQRDGYFQQACRYVVLNPVRAGLVERPEDWIWSSYASTAGLAPRPRLLTTAWIVGPPPASEWQADYQSFVAAGALDSDATRAFRGDAPIVGSDTFIAAYRGLIEQAHPTEVVRRERIIGRPTLAELFADVRDRATRDIRIREARERFLYRLSDIGSYLSLHNGTVSRLARASESAQRGGQSDRPTATPAATNA